MPFQKSVGTQPAPAVAGDFASANPRLSALAGPGGFIAGPNGLVVGRFAWQSMNVVDSNDAPAQVNNTGSGIVTGFVLYLRERRRCDALACRMAGGRITLALLMLASLVVATTIVLDRFPEMSSDLLVRLTDGGTHGSASGHKMDDMK